MSNEAVLAQIKNACRDLGLSGSLIDRLRMSDAGGGASQTAGGNVDGRPNSATRQIQQLESELGRVRAERDQLLEQQQQILMLLEAKHPDKLLHDLRNVLNERALLRSLVDLQGS